MRFDPYATSTIDPPREEVRKLVDDYLSALLLSATDSGNVEQFIRYTDEPDGWWSRLDGEDEDDTEEAVDELSTLAEAALAELNAHLGSSIDEDELDLYGEALLEGSGVSYLRMGYPDTDLIATVMLNEDTSFELIQRFVTDEFVLSSVAEGNSEVYKTLREVLAQDLGMLGHLGLPADDLRDRANAVAVCDAAQEKHKL